jgi:hypothetical protein
MLRRQVVMAVFLRGDEYKRRDREEPLPDGRFRRQLDKVVAFAENWPSAHTFMLCAAARWRIGPLADAGFGELRGSKSRGDGFSPPRLHRITPS